MSGYVGGSGPADVARLRRMTAEPTLDTYSDAELTTAIERYPLDDDDGYAPDDDAWSPTYDHALAAADVWAEKCVLLAANFDFQADGATFSKSQQYEHSRQQAKLWRALRRPGSHTVLPYARAATPSWIGNVNNPYE